MWGRVLSKLNSCFGADAVEKCHGISRDATEGEVAFLPRDGGGKIGKVTQELYDILTGIQWGKREDVFNWVYKL